MLVKRLISGTGVVMLALFGAIANAQNSHIKFYYTFRHCLSINACESRVVNFTCWEDVQGGCKSDDDCQLFLTDDCDRPLKKL